MDARSVMNILFLDDDQMRHDAFETAHPNATIWHAYDHPSFLKQLAKLNRFDVISFDHDLGLGANGYDCAMELLMTFPSYRWPTECWVHSWNPVGAERIMRALRNAGIPTIRTSFWNPKAV